MVLLIGQPWPWLLQNLNIIPMLISCSRCDSCPTEDLLEPIIFFRPLCKYSPNISSYATFFRCYLLNSFNCSCLPQKCHPACCCHVILASWTVRIWARSHTRSSDHLRRGESQRAYTRVHLGFPSAFYVTCQLILMKIVNHNQNCQAGYLICGTRRNILTIIQEEYNEPDQSTSLQSFELH